MVADRRAFTLIEMLLVVSIISLLIAILLPSLSRSRVAAREVSCRANMGQIGRATTAYAADNHGQYPANRFRPRPEEARHVTWRSLVVTSKYVSDGDIWICPNPADRAISELGYSIHGSYCEGDVKKSNYAYNGAAFWRFSPNGAPDGSDGGNAGRYGMPNGRSELTLRNVRYPNRTFILLETREIYPDLGDWCVTWGENTGITSIGGWHRRGANWAIVDGSVTWARLLDTAKTDCWWHNLDEPQNAHVAWTAQLLAYPNNPHNPNLPSN